MTRIINPLNIISKTGSIRLGEYINGKSIHSVHRNICRSANKRGLEFNLSHKKLRELLLKTHCEITGKLLSNKQNSHYLRTIDRKDNRKGYTDDNVVVCTRRINSLKGSLLPEDIELLYKFMIKEELIKNQKEKLYIKIFSSIIQFFTKPFRYYAELYESW